MKPRSIDASAAGVLRCLVLPWSVVAVGLVLVLPSRSAVAEEIAAGSLRLTLPPTVYAVPGVEMSIYFDNVVLTSSPAGLAFSVACDVGQAEPTRWTVTPSPAHVGDHRLVLTVRDASGQVLATGSSTVRVSPRDAGSQREIALLIVGDSLTHASLYPNEIARLLSLPENPRWQMLGTHQPSSAAPRVAHEGYGGWTWRAFTTRFDPAAPSPGKTTSSPFVFAAGDPAAGRLDVARYVADRCSGRAPDFVVFLLGINDCFRLKAEDSRALDAGIEEMFRDAEKLLAAFRAAAPQADLGVGLTTPPNARDAAFEANYKGNYPRWNWRQVQHRLVEREMDHFRNREHERIFLVPTELNLDPVAGYPENNGVHPNALGYQQIGASIYAWLKSRLAAQAGVE